MTQDSNANGRTISAENTKAHAMSLHRAFFVFVAVLSVVALTAVVSLIVLTTYLHRETVDLESGLHSVRLAEEMQIELLSYVRSRNDVERAFIERDLRRKLQQAQQYVGSPEEDAVLAKASQLLEAHFTQQRQFPDAEQYDGNLEGGFAALRQFVDMNVQQAEDSLQQSERWDEIGDRIGVGVGAGLIVSVTIILVWLGLFAFRPVFEIRDAMKDFAGGRKNVRAPEHGPEELRSIAAQFNSMADALLRQYDNQLTFLAAVAHDLRNPLGALKISADILSSGQTIPSDKLASLLLVIKRQVHRLDRLVGDLLDAARIEAGHLELRLENYDARKIAQDSFDLFSSASRGHRFTLKIPDTALPLYCDPLRIEQVLNNLISNAIKYSPNGGQIELCLEEQAHEVLFSVSDHGLGIATDELPYIFEPFRRANSSKEDVAGVGLGLSVSQRIVQAHGGRIQAESQLGKGTTFEVHLQNLPAALLERAG